MTIILVVVLVAVDMQFINYLIKHVSGDYQNEDHNHEFVELLSQVHVSGEAI